MQAKHLLRKAILEKREQMLPSQKQQWDETILTYLKKMVLERNVQSVHTFISMPNEVNTLVFIQWLLDRNVTVVCPKTLTNRQLEHRVLTSLHELENGKFATKHPQNTLIFEHQPELIIVPGLAFDKLGYRMGYGAGYYDTFLAQWPNAYKVGVCYPFQLVNEVPTEAHDARMDEVVVGG